MKNLFSKGNRIYQKGFSCEGFVKSLDIDLILNKISKTIEPLIKELIDDKIK